MSIDLNRVQKQFCENVTIGFSQEAFIVGMLNGESGAFYVLTPQHIKRLTQYLSAQLTDYEKKFGTIDAVWKPGIESPIQTKDILEGR